MVNRVPVRMTLAAPVANAGTVSVAYPAGSAQVDFVDGNALAQGRVVLNDNDVLTEPSQVSFAYGPSTVVVTNTTGAAWPAGTPLLIVLAGGPVASAPGGGGGATVQQVMDAIADAVGEGNVLVVEDGDLAGLPVVEGAAATAWDLLTGLAEGLSDQGAALKDWQDAQRAGGVIAAGVATFDWPEDEDGARNRSGYARWLVGAEDDDAGTVSFAVEERPSEISDIDQVLTLTLEFENDTGSSLTVQPAAPAGGRETVSWAEGNANVTLADGDVLRVYVNVYPDGCLAHAEVVAS